MVDNRIFGSGNDIFVQHQCEVIVSVAVLEHLLTDLAARAVGSYDPIDKALFSVAGAYKCPVIAYGVVGHADRDSVF